MSWQSRAITAICSLVLIYLVGYLLKRRKLEPEYALLWLLTGVVLFILALWENLLFLVTSLIGAKLAASTMFFFALIFLGAIALHYSVKISQLEKRVRRLTQELSIMKDEAKNEQTKPQ